VFAQANYREQFFEIKQGETVSMAIQVGWDVDIVLKGCD
jgi:hypothetical protein